MGTLEASAAKVDITPPLGVPSPLGSADNRIRQVNGEIYATLLLLRQDGKTLAWLTLNLCMISAELEEAISKPLAGWLGIPQNHVVIGCTRNLSTPLPFGRVEGGSAPELPRLPYHDSTVTALVEAAKRAATRFVPVKLRYAEGFLPELQYNRKGCRPDGTTFFVREEDLRRDPEWVGLIDPRVPVLRLDEDGGAPVAIVTQYIGDPCMAMQLESPAVSPDLPGYATDFAARELGRPDLPVLYFQGCKGDIAIRHMFAGENKARQEGERLGSLIARLAVNPKPLEGDTLSCAHGRATLPLQPLSSVAQLEREKAEIATFLKRLEEGDAAAQEVLGHNFPENSSLAHRTNYAKGLEVWVNWAIKTQKSGEPIRRQVQFEVHAFQLGELAVVTTAPELFGRIGLDIQKRSPFQHSIVACCCGYPWRDMPGAARWAYVPGSADLDGNEYMTAFYRHTRFLTQYAPPAGDALGEKAIELLRALKGQRYSSGHRC